MIESKINILNELIRETKESLDELSKSDFDTIEKQIEVRSQRKILMRILKGLEDKLENYIKLSS